MNRYTMLKVLLWVTGGLFAWALILIAIALNDMESIEEMKYEHEVPEGTNVIVYLNCAEENRVYYGNCILKGQREHDKTE